MEELLALLKEMKTEFDGLRKEIAEVKDSQIRKASGKQIGYIVDLADKAGLETYEIEGVVIPVKALKRVTSEAASAAIKALGGEDKPAPTTAPASSTAKKVVEVEF